MAEASWLGDCVVERRDIGTDRERIVVTKADPAVLCSRELLADMGSEDNPYVSRDGDRYTFGTEGEGVGVVTYEVEPQDRWLEYVGMRRVS